MKAIIFLSIALIFNIAIASQNENLEEVLKQVTKVSAKKVSIIDEKLALLDLKEKLKS